MYPIHAGHKTYVLGARTPGHNVTTVRYNICDSAASSARETVEFRHDRRPPASAATENEITAKLLSRGSRRDPADGRRPTSARIPPPRRVTPARRFYHNIIIINGNAKRSVRFLKITCFLWHYSLVLLLVIVGTAQKTANFEILFFFLIGFIFFFYVKSSFFTIVRYFLFFYVLLRHQLHGY